jgi:hypothetical protein
VTLKTLAAPELGTISQETVFPDLCVPLCTFVLKFKHRGTQRVSQRYTEVGNQEDYVGFKVTNCDLKNLGSIGIGNDKLRDSLS